MLFYPNTQLLQIVFSVLNKMNKDCLLAGWKRKTGLRYVLIITQRYLRMLFSKFFGRTMKNFSEYFTEMTLIIKSTIFRYLFYGKIRFE